MENEEGFVDLKDTTLHRSNLASTCVYLAKHHSEECLQMENELGELASTFAGFFTCTKWEDVLNLQILTLHGSNVLSTCVDARYRQS